MVGSRICFTKQPWRRQSQITTTLEKMQGPQKWLFQNIFFETILSLSLECFILIATEIRKHTVLLSLRELLDVSEYKKENHKQHLNVWGQTRNKKNETTSVEYTSNSTTNVVFYMHENDSIATQSKEGKWPLHVNCLSFAVSTN